MASGLDDTDTAVSVDCGAVWRSEGGELDLRGTVKVRVVLRSKSRVFVFVFVCAFILPFAGAAFPALCGGRDRDVIRRALVVGCRSGYSLYRLVARCVTADPLALP